MAYEGYTLEWAQGRLRYADEALNHIDAHGLVPNDGRPATMAGDLPPIEAVYKRLGYDPDTHATIQRVKAFLREQQMLPIGIETTGGRRETK